MCREGNDSKRFAVLVCEDAEKWGGKDHIGRRFKSLFEREDDTEWRWFNACAGDLPAAQDLDKYQGVIISGSHYSANDDKEWIRQTEELIVSLAKKPTSPRLVGICFGHQLVAKALGGVVGKNPSGKFVLQTEKVRSTKENSIVSRLFENGPIDVLKSHSECVTELPAKAQSLASSSTCEHEIILFTENILGVQFHTECTPEEFEEKILPVLLSYNVLTKEEGEMVRESFKIPVQSFQVNNMLRDFLQQSPKDVERP